MKYLLLLFFIITAHARYMSKPVGDVSPVMVNMPPPPPPKLPVEPMPQQKPTEGGPAKDIADNAAGVADKASKINAGTFKQLDYTLSWTLAGAVLLLI